MNNQVIIAEGLTKEYQLGVTNHGTLRRDLESLWARLKGHTDPNSLIGTTETSNLRRFLALDDVSFAVDNGEILGVIGANGAGKSTLLKILSRITAPSSGHVRIKGRVASLLEVGTGFHPELTGRENVYLNGAILGMTKSEITRRFDGIVDFSGVEKFIDTPVKRYSSGMYVRLAFAVAAHLEPEILIVDEVLAVGDAQFQKKCLGKMAEVGKAGRTIIFVSHNMTAVRNLCEKAIWLRGGKICQAGETQAVTNEYLQQFSCVSSMNDICEAIKFLPDDPDFTLLHVDITQDGKTVNTVLNGSPVVVEMRYRVLRKVSGLRVFFDLCDTDRNILIRTFHDENDDFMSEFQPGEYVSRATIPKDLLSPTDYELVFRAGIFNIRSCLPEGLGVTLSVQSSNGINRAYSSDVVRSKLVPKISWDNYEAS